MKPLLLSQAIRRGAEFAPQSCKHAYLKGDASDPLGAAYLGSLRIPDRHRFRALMAASSHESINDMVCTGLLRAFPVLWRSVREHDAFCAYLVRERLLPRLPDESVAYHWQHHPSLCAVITGLHDKEGWSKDQVAGLLSRCGL